MPEVGVRGVMVIVPMIGLISCCPLSVFGRLSIKPFKLGAIQLDRDYKPAQPTQSLSTLSGGKRCLPQSTLVTVLLNNEYQIPLAFSYPNQIPIYFVDLYNNSLSR